MSEGRPCRYHVLCSNGIRLPKNRLGRWLSGERLTPRVWILRTQKKPDPVAYVSAMHPVSKDEAEEATGRLEQQERSCLKNKQVERQGLAPEVVL